MRQVDPYLALVRNAVFAEQGPPRVSPLDRRTPPRSVALEPVSDEVREQHAYELAEREGLLMDSGFPEFCGSKVYHGGDCCARHAALSDLGSVEFYYELMKRGGDGIGEFKPIPVPVPVGFCTRCESVGHMPATCPFPAGDDAVTRIARLRRERREGREEAA